MGPPKEILDLIRGSHLDLVYRGRGYCQEGPSGPVHHHGQGGQGGQRQ